MLKGWLIKIFDWTEKVRNKFTKKCFFCIFISIAIGCLYILPKSTDKMTFFLMTQGTKSDFILILKLSHFCF